MPHCVGTDSQLYSLVFEVVTVPVCHQVLYVNVHCVYAKSTLPIDAIVVVYHQVRQVITALGLNE